MDQCTPSLSINTHRTGNYCPPALSRTMILNALMNLSICNHATEIMTASLHMVDFNGQ